MKSQTETAYSLQPTAYSLQPTAYSLQSAVCSLQSAVSGDRGWEGRLTPAAVFCGINDPTLDCGE